MWALKKEKRTRNCTNPGEDERSSGPESVHSVKVEPRLRSRNTVNAMQKQSKSLILDDPTAEIASCLNLCAVRRLLLNSKLPLITINCFFFFFLLFFFFQILFVFKLNRLVEAEPSPEIRHRINDVTTFSANLLVVVGRREGVVTVRLRCSAVASVKIEVRVRP